jgi:bacterioferritin-associated ferredoxin
MHPDDLVCLCHRVSLHKLRGFIERERPEVASRLSECLGAGTGCGWCVPFLTRLHEMWAKGEIPDLAESPENYAARRIEYKRERAARKAQSLENQPPHS